MTTREVSQGRKRADLDMCLSVVWSELKKAEHALTKYGARSTRQAAVVLRERIDNLQQAKAALVALKRG